LPIPNKIEIFVGTVDKKLKQPIILKLDYFLIK